MSKLSGKQVNKLLSGYIRINGISALGLSTDVTAAVTTALATAGYNGQALAVTPSSGPLVEGLAVTAPVNRIEIFDSISKDKIEASSREIYGRLTESVGIYTLSYYFKDPSGVETVYSFGAITTIDIEIIYRFKFGQLPTDILVGLTARNVNLDEGGGTSGTVYTQVINVASLNNLANLTYLPTSPSSVVLFINTKPEFALGATPSFSMTGQQITWNPSNAKYDVDVTDVVVAQYTTLQI